MNEPNKGWRESDAGKFFETHKVPILVGAAIVLALSFSGSERGGQGGEPIPIVQDGPGGSGGAPMSNDEWQADQDRRQRQHDKFIETIREEQTCSNGKVIPASDTCPDE